ncbi:hypothetical protein [Methylovorus glucosotrophus]|uniref:hypothetical protein n=1 Tax=Methylovorus glucosotrophus TaxID=266009 RepID=UPI0013317E13|nr:hypothetical protein [Methylovorus glucosotrophus]
MLNPVDFILFAAACVIFVRAVHIVSFLRRETWPARWKFFAFSLSIGFLAAGAFAVAFGFNWGAPLFLLGVAGYLLFDRRLQNAKRTTVLGGF